MPPLITYFNLPEEKQDRILKAAIDEFGCKGYRRGSIKAIADKAKVSKGSMYQYFKNKEELFLYIFDIIVDLKLDYLNQIIDRREEFPFFKLIERICCDTIKFARENPGLHQIYNKLMKGAPEGLKDKVEEKVKKQGIRIYRGYIVEAIARQEIRDDLDIDFLAFTVYHLLEEFGQNLGEKVLEMSDAEIKVEVAQFIDFMKNGIDGKLPFKKWREE